MKRFALISFMITSAVAGTALAQNPANPVQAVCVSTKSGMVSCKGADKNRTDRLSIHVSSSDGKLITSGMIGVGKEFSFKKPSVGYTISIENEKDHHRQLIEGTSVK